jgi:hypothetical protein
MSESLWWSEFVPLVGPGFSKTQATQLHRTSLKRVGDAWKGNSFLLVETVKDH